MSRALRCPSCGATPDECEFLGTQRVRGEVTYIIEGDGSDSVISPAETEITDHIGPLELTCRGCGHQWPTSREFRVRMYNYS